MIGELAFLGAVLASSGELLLEVPHVEQAPDFCGEACAEMALARLGKRWDQHDVFAAAGVDPGLGRGLYTAELKRALERIGFDTGAVWSTVPADRPRPALEATWRAIVADLGRGHPTIVCMRFDASPDTTEHFRLIVGWDPRENEVVYHEPAYAGAAYRRMKLDDFLELWPLKYERDAWTLVRLRLEPRSIAAAAPARERFRPADYAQHVRALKEKLPRGFSVVIEPPFVVTGDLPPATLERHATSTVRWAVSRLKARYFERDPEHILTIWLFRDAESYERNVRRLFGESPDTPYGYYSPRHRALIMNIATGGGTLVHELVHPFVASNIDDAPAWLNEGLGSLYEQCGERDGRIVGYTNWRLEGLKEAIAGGSVPSFRRLTAMDDETFYGRGSGTHYAAARYLLYYLQEHDQLDAFYRRFRAHHARDRTGYRALVETLGEKDMRAFEARWRAWVLGLSFPG